MMAWIDAHPTPAFRADTLLMDAWMDDEALFDRLVGAFPGLRRFARVLLREDTACRLDLADVASMADLTLSEFLAVANGDAVGAENERKIAGPPLPSGRPDWLQKGADLARFDARPLLETGHEPLADILRFVASTAPGSVLAIEATFHPLPLRRLLGRRGYETFAECLSPDHWRIYARRQAA